MPPPPRPRTGAGSPAVAPPRRAGPAASSNSRMRTIRRWRSIWTSVDSSIRRTPFFRCRADRRATGSAVAPRPSATSGGAVRSRRAVPRAALDAWVVRPARAPCRSGRGNARACCTARHLRPAGAGTSPGAAGRRSVQSARRTRVRRPARWCAAAAASAPRSGYSLRYNSSSVSNGSTPGDQPVVGVGHLHRVRLDRRVGDELAAQRVGPQREHPGRLDAVGPAEIERGVGAVQRNPSSAALDPRRGWRAAPLRTGGRRRCS